MSYTRKSGLFKASYNLEVLADAPIDARTTTPYYSGLTDGNIPYPYSGMTVLVYADPEPDYNGLWYCTYPGSGNGVATSGSTLWTKVGGKSITGGTYVQSARTLSFSGANNNGFTVDGDLFDGYGLKQLDLDPTTLILSATTRNDEKITVNLTPVNVLFNYVTGGTYDITAGTITFRSVSGTPFPVSGFTTGLTTTTGATYYPSQGVIEFTKTGTVPAYSATGFNYVTGFTVNDVTNSISGYTNISGETVVYGGIITAVTGGTFSNGNLYLSGTGLISSGVTITGFSGGTNYTGGTSSAGTGATTAITATLYSSGNSVSVPIDMSDAFKFTNVNPVRRTVGGIANTSSPFISGKTMHQIIQEIFYPNDPPTIVDADGALSRTAGVTTPYGIIGQVVNMTLDAVYTSGTSTATGQGTVSTGAMSAFTYNGGGLSNATELTTSPTDTTNDNSYTIIQGTNQWSCVFTFNVGGQPVDVDGNPYQSTDTIQFTSPVPLTRTTSFEGVYPISATSSSLNSLTQQTLVSASANSVIIPLVAETDGTYRQRFITPNNMGTVASINYPDILGNFTSDNFISQFTINTTNVDVNSNATNVLYNTYTYNAGIRQNLNIRVNFN
jgi:hypothetical protein